jgi:hypothetical protein
VQAPNGPDDVENRIDGADLVQVHAVDCDGVDSRFFFG